METSLGLIPPSRPVEAFVKIVESAVDAGINRVSADRLPTYDLGGSSEGAQAAMQKDLKSLQHSSKNTRFLAMRWIMTG